MVSKTIHELKIFISNIASYKNIEKLGAVFIELVVPSKDYMFFHDRIEAHGIYR